MAAGSKMKRLAVAFFITCAFRFPVQAANDGVTVWPVTRLVAVTHDRATGLRNH
jgi:hypothetical protein